MAIFTIGYGSRKFADFVALLQQNGIYLVVDLRRFPNSKAPEYNKESLEAGLPQFGISYIWMGDTLGGLRRGGYPILRLQCNKSILRWLALPGEAERCIDTPCLNWP